MTIVLDASVAGALILQEPDVNPAAILRREARFLAPAIFGFEVVHTLRRAVLGGRLTSDQLKEGLDLLDRWPLEIVGEDPLSLADRSASCDLHGLTVYDAAYLRLALLTASTLATYDRRMRSAARGANIPLLPLLTPYELATTRA